MAYYDAGILRNTPDSYHSYWVTQNQPDDYFEFDVYGGSFGGSEVNLYLHNISANGDANLFLFKDLNHNGILDLYDAPIAFSLESGNADEVINLQAETGTYFARVVLNELGSVGNVSYDLDLSGNYNVGALGSTPESYDNNFISEIIPTEIIEFEIRGPRTIHLTLDGIDPDGDVDLRLYQDNGNGFLDDGDTLVAASLYGDGGESIDYKASADTYFAEVSYGPGSEVGFFQYDLNMSATGGFAKVSNLVVGEVEVGDITYSTPDQTGWIGDPDTTDQFAFSVDLYEGVNITLTGLTGDVDIRLVKDTNNNGIVDTGEIIASSNSIGTSDEHINDITTSGDYVVQVHTGFYSDDAYYDLQFDRFTTPYP